MKVILGLIVAGFAGLLLLGVVGAVVYRQSCADADGTAHRHGGSDREAGGSDREAGRFADPDAAPEPDAGPGPDSGAGLACERHGHHAARPGPPASGS